MGRRPVENTDRISPGEGEHAGNPRNRNPAGVRGRSPRIMNPLPGHGEGAGGGAITRGTRGKALLSVFHRNLKITLKNRRSVLVCGKPINQSEGFV